MPSEKERLQVRIRSLQERIRDLEVSDRELARANAHAAEMMADIELRDEEIMRLNDALSSANSRAAELVAESEIRMEELERSNDELKQFTYVVSHDLREPLRMITSFAKLLARDYSGQLEPRAEEFVDYIVDGAARMDALIVGLLAYSRAGKAELSLEPLPVGEIIETALTSLDAAVHESEAVIDFEDMPTVVADRRQFVQLFQNLLGNAMKFKGEDPPRVQVSAHQADSKWVFSVSDNGIGLASEQGERIFKIFQRLHTSAKYPGTGIGLAICKQVVQRHGGRIWVEPRPGKGTTFFFTIPIPANVGNQI